MINPLNFIDEDAYWEAVREEEAGFATPSEACREYAYNIGGDHPDRAWLLTDYDTWERNPHYQGPPVSHPEEDADDAAREDTRQFHGAMVDGDEVPF